MLKRRKKDRIKTSKKEFFKSCSIYFFSEKQNFISGISSMHKLKKKPTLKYARAYYNYNDFCRSVFICKFLPSFIPTCAVAAHFDPNHTDPDKSTSMESLIDPFPKPNRFLSHLITGKLTSRSRMTRVVFATNIGYKTLYRSKLLYALQICHMIIRN